MLHREPSYEEARFRRWLKSLYAIRRKEAAVFASSQSPPLTTPPFARLPGDDAKPGKATPGDSAGVAVKTTQRCAGFAGGRLGERAAAARSRRILFR